MDKIPKIGYEYIKEFMEEKEKPDLNEERIGIIEQGVTINYEWLEKNEFGIWLIYIQDEKMIYIINRWK